MLNVAVIGMGNMGSKYAVMISQGRVKGMRLLAATRIHPERYEAIKDILPDDILIYQSGELLFEAVDKGELEVDAVIIVTPHYSHEELAINAFNRGISVLCDKPAGVYSRQGRNMLECYIRAKKSYPDLQYGFIFHQRTYPVYEKLREIVQSGRYGGIKRVNWVVTDWYRSNEYYGSGSWRATWKGDGGGTILNQCPHNIDLLQWICGMPVSVQAFCHEGKYHPIEVEDDVTAYMEWENGATGVFIASTGEAAGVNRFEISMDDALLICENGGIIIHELDKPELEYRNAKGDIFAKPRYEVKSVEVEPAEDAYVKMLSAFADEKVIADGYSGLYNLYLTNAIYLSSWEGSRVSIPEAGSENELLFERQFESWLSKKKSI